MDQTLRQYSAFKRSKAEIALIEAAKADPRRRVRVVHIYRPDSFFRNDRHAGRGRMTAAEILCAQGEFRKVSDETTRETTNRATRVITRIAIFELCA